MVTEIPARILKLNHNKGKIEPRYDADLVLFDSDFNPIKVIQNGIVVVE
jgi:N-acetylglucosamine-6-phosphate deacetylase